MSAGAMTGLGGFAQGFAQSYNAAQIRKTQQQLDQRNQLASVYASSLPNARPEAQQEILGRLASIYTTPIHKKLDKSLTDISTLYQAPQGYGSQGGQPSGGVPAMPQPQQSIGAMPPTQPEQLPPGFVGPPQQIQSQAPPVNVTGMTPSPGGDTSPQQFGGGLQLTPPPPKYQPFYTPEERAQQEAQAASLKAGMDIQAQINARKRIGEQMGLQGEDLSRFALGAAPLIAHTQLKAYVTPDAPTTPKYGNYDNLHQTFLDLNGNEVPNAMPYEASQQPTTPWRTFLAAGRQQGLADTNIINDWNRREASHNGFKIVQQPDGSTVMVPFTETTTSSRGQLAPAPGQTPSPAPATNAPAGNAKGPGGTPGASAVPGGGGPRPTPQAGISGPGRVVGGRPATPKEIKDNATTLGQVNLAIPRLQNLHDNADVISKLIDAGRISFAIGQDGSIHAAIGRGANLTEKEAKFAADFQAMSEDINLLRAPLGATGFRSEDAFQALQAQRGRLYQNPQVFKLALENTIDSMKALQSNLDNFNTRYGQRLTPPPTKGGGTGAAVGVAGDKITIISHGVRGTIPRANLDAAKKADPSLQVVQ